MPLPSHTSFPKASYIINGNALNLAEIELSVLGRQCLDRRLGEWNLLRQEVTVWTARGNQPKYKINCSFGTAEACIKLQNLYPSCEG